MKFRPSEKTTTLHSFFIRVQVLALSLVVVALAIYFVYSFRFIERRIQQSTETVLSIVTDRIVRATNETNILAFSVAYNPEVQRSLYESDILSLIQYSNTYYAIAETIAGSSELIDDVALFTSDLSIFRNISSDITYADYKLTLIDHLKKHPYDESRIAAIDLDTKEEYLCIVLPVYSHASGEDSNSLIGYCLTSFLVERIATLFRQISALKNSHIVVYDETGSTITSSLPPSRSARTRDTLESHPNRFISSGKPLAGINAELVAFIPKREIYLSQWGFFVFSALLVGMLLWVNFLVAARMSKAFGRPIEHLVDQLESIDGSDREHRIDQLPENEIGYIGISINSMLDKIHEMTERSIQINKRMSDLELHSKEAELLALQAQINPHFMYNTLECMRSIGLDYGSEEIVHISTALAEILRYCLNTEFHVRLDRELAIIDRYFQILKYRFGERYALETEIENDVLSTHIIKMTIQPIVENAIFHGLEKRKTGALSIRIGKDDDMLVIRIRDNGKGMSAQQLLTLRERLNTDDGNHGSSEADKRSVGLLNIHKRIQTYYGSMYGIEIWSEPELGTEVLMRVPMMINSDDRAADPQTHIII